MIQTKIEIIKLTASDGHVLTNGEAFGKDIYLGKNDSPEKWQEITELEAQALLQKREETEFV